MDWDIMQIALWLIASLVSFYFSLGNARVWTSISIGFFLVLFAEVLPSALPFLPGTDIPHVEAMGYIVGTIAILVMSHGFQEYYVFSRTLEFEGSKTFVYLGVLGVIAGSVAFLLINPAPTPTTLRIIRIVGLTNWVFLSLINIDLIRKIYLNIKDTPIGKGIVAFIVVFASIFFWKGSELYLEVYDLVNLAESYPFRYQLSVIVSNLGNLAASISVGATFLYLARAMR
jgi:hypothetical protein